MDQDRQQPQPEDPEDATPEPTDARPPSPGPMDAVRWNELREAVAHAHELSPAERGVYLAALARTDPAFGDEVRRLLARVDERRGFLEPPSPESLERPLRRLSFDFAGCMLGEFELVEEIGRGASGVVYLGRQRSLGRDVAIKILAPQLCSSTEHRERFRRESQAASRIRHPNVVSVLSFGEQSGALYLVMEHVAGRSLHDLVEDARAQTAGGAAAQAIRPARAAELVAAVARGLAECHRAGVIHRDVKPHNVLVDERGEPRLLDFGLAKMLGLQGLTETGSISGTPHYMSPEQARAQADLLDARSDVYSAGAVLYELLTLRPPFTAEATPQVIDQILHGNLLPPHRVRPGVPRTLSAICMRALSRAPGARYATADAFADDLQEFLSGRAVAPGLRWELEDRAGALVRRWPWLPAAGLAVVMGVTIALFPRAQPVSAHAPASAAGGVADHETGRPPADNTGRKVIRILEAQLPDTPLVRPGEESDDQ